jgi:branched-chain amino acid transport system substrate-binding protein
MNRRTFVKSAGATVGLGAAAAFFPARAQRSGTVRIGALIDTSGPLSVFGENKLRCLRLGVQELNDGGGLLGRTVEVVHYDTQSGNQQFAQFAQRLALSDNVDVVFGCTTSASRETVRPILARAKKLYFYNTNYEGGVCQRSTICSSTTPAQMVEPLFPGLIKEHGKRIYVLAADYNYGHISAKWAAKIAKDNGAEVIGREFFPLDVNNFSATITHIQSAKPDFIHTVFVGPAHGAFWGQWASAGMVGKIPISSQTFGLAGEHLQIPPAVTEGIYVCLNYFEEIDSPANQDFLGKFRKVHGTGYGYIGELAMAEYQGLKLYAEAVRKANSTEAEKVLEAIGGGITVAAPSGQVRLDPVTNHCTVDMYLARVKGGKFDIVRSFKAVPPSNPGNKCDLVKNPNTNQQFEPEI